MEWILSLTSFFEITTQGSLGRALRAPFEWIFYTMIVFFFTFIPLELQQSKSSVPSIYKDLFDLCKQEAHTYATRHFLATDTKFDIWTYFCINNKVEDKILLHILFMKMSQIVKSVANKRLLTFIQIEIQATKENPFLHILDT